MITCRNFSFFSQSSLNTVRHCSRPQFSPELSGSFNKFIITLRLLLTVLVIFVAEQCSSFNFNTVSISAGFNYFSRSIITNINRYLTDRISHECYASDSFRTTEERKYSTTCSNLPASRLWIMFTFSFLYLWEIARLGNNIQHTTRRTSMAQGYWCNNLRGPSSLRYIRKYKKTFNVLHVHQGQGYWYNNRYWIIYAFSLLYDI